MILIFVSIISELAVNFILEDVKSLYELFIGVLGSLPRQLKKRFNKIYISHKVIEFIVLGFRD